MNCIEGIGQSNGFADDTQQGAESHGDRSSEVSKGKRGRKTEKRLTNYSIYLMYLSAECFKI